MSLNNRKSSASFDGNFSRVARAITRLIRHWWLGDQVQVALREGRILRLRPPALIMHEGREIEVVGRSVGRGHDGAFVSYDCRTDDGPMVILVSTVGSITLPRITWIERGEEHSVMESELEIWEM